MLDENKYDEINNNDENTQENIFAEEDVTIPEVTTDEKELFNDGETMSGENNAQDAAEEAAQEAPVEAEAPQDTTYRYSYIKKAEESNAAQDTVQRASGEKNTKKHKKSMSSYAKAIACAIVCGVIIGGCVLGSFAIGRNMTGGTNTASTTVAGNANSEIKTTEAKLSESSSSSSDSSASTGTYSVAQIAAKCSSSVVAITNKGITEVQTIFGTYQQESEGSGSGVIIAKTDDELLIATNNHVVSGAQELTVCFNDSPDSVYSAQIKGTDADNDLAVVAIKLSDISQEDLNSISIATIGKSEDLQVGDGVVAIGNALGLGQSVTSGVVSALEREVTIDTTTATLLQTDAAINPGNSGGALFNMKGELIGINSAKYASTQVEGMGFAIPISTAQPIIENLMNRETRDKLTENYGFLNISGADVDETDSAMYGVPVGVYVSAANEGGAAANAGIQKGDIITSLDGVSVTSISSLKDLLTYYAAGETVDVVIYRNSGSGYEEMTVSVKLDNASENSTSSSGTTQNNQQNSSQGSQGYSYPGQDSQGSQGFSFPGESSQDSSESEDGAFNPFN